MPKQSRTKNADNLLCKPALFLLGDFNGLDHQIIVDRVCPRETRFRYFISGQGIDCVIILLVRRLNLTSVCALVHLT